MKDYDIYGNMGTHPEETGGFDMPDYHSKLFEIRVRIPVAEAKPEDADRKPVPEVVKRMRARAKDLGFIDKKSGDGSINAYIIDLMEKDIQQEDPEFTIPRSQKEFKPTKK